MSSSLRPAAASLRNVPFLPHLATRLTPAFTRALAPYDLVIVPGLFGSGSDHWQSIWQSLFLAHGLSVSRVEQHDWSNPTPAAWHNALDLTLRATRKPVLLVAHSLGAILSVQHGLRRHQATDASPSPVVGALLAAPADGTHHKGPDAPRIAAFMPPPTQTLPFPATVLFSHNDPWLTTSQAHTLAQRWGATLMDAGYNGHLGQDAELEHWPLGLNALHALALTCQSKAAIFTA